MRRNSSSQKNSKKTAVLTQSKKQTAQLFDHLEFTTRSPFQTITSNELTRPRISNVRHYLQANSTQLTSADVEIATSELYQDLLAKMKNMQAERNKQIMMLKQIRKERKTEAESIESAMNAIKMEMWERIGKICKLKDSILAEREKKLALNEYIMNLQGENMSNGNEAVRPTEVQIVQSQPYQSEASSQQIQEHSEEKSSP